MEPSVDALNFTKLEGKREREIGGSHGNIQPSPTQLYTLLEMLILLYDTEIQISSTQTFIPFVLQSSVVHQVGIFSRVADNTTRKRKSNYFKYVFVAGTNHQDSLISWTEDSCCQV